MTSKYRIPLRDGREVKVTPAQFAAAINWADLTQCQPDAMRHIVDVFYQRDNWANGMRRCAWKLADLGVLRQIGHAGFVMDEVVREHLDRYRYK